MLDIPALSRLASLAPQHLKLPTYFCANPNSLIISPFFLILADYFYKNRNTGKYLT